MIFKKTIVLRCLQYSVGWKSVALLLYDLEIYNDVTSSNELNFKIRCTIDQLAMAVHNFER